MSSQHDRPDDELRDRVQQYLLGTLPAAERTEFALHLAGGCAVCNEELRSAEQLAAEIAFAAPPAAPPADLKERLFARLRATPSAAEAPRTADVQVWKQWSAAPSSASHLLRADEGAFEPTAAPGVFVRKLHVDPAANRATMMVRMEPGSSYPSHRHGGGEECYVLSGDLRHGDRVMRAGDYEHVTGGSAHGRQWTEGGCLLLIHSALNDELLER